MWVLLLLTNTKKSHLITLSMKWFNYETCINKQINNNIVIVNIFKSVSEYFQEFNSKCYCIL